ncbi:hypothetical protein RSAG8_04845, partial [Rhizoctonia solani AG-8 WAC10335]
MSNITLSYLSTF